MKDAGSFDSDLTWGHVRAVILFIMIVAYHWLYYLPFHQMFLFYVFFLATRRAIIKT